MVATGAMLALGALPTSHGWAGREDTKSASIRAKRSVRRQGSEARSCVAALLNDRHSSLCDGSAPIGRA